MPTYDYECTECGDEFSVEQSMTDRPLRKCRKCGGKLRKLLPRSLNLIFKGSGFYVTDYARGRAEKGPSGESAGARKDAAGAGRDAAGAGDGLEHNGEVAPIALYPWRRPAN